MVDYEWDVELVSAIETQELEAGEIIGHYFTPSYFEARKFCDSPIEVGMTNKVVLVRDDDNGRSWAYMEEGKLPEFFEDAYQHPVAKVPQRFRKEVERA